MTQQAPPGWYPDPYAAGAPQQRYWDGATWTPETFPAAATAPPVASPPSPAWGTPAAGTSATGYGTQPAEALMPSGTSRRSDRTTGKELLSASWQALKQDKQLLILPVLAAATSTVAILLFLGLGWVIGLNDKVITSVSGGQQIYTSAAAWVAAVVLTYVTTAIAIYFQVALAAGATQRLDGGDPTLSSCLAVANSRLPQILTWALIAATVGVILRSISERVGFVGDLLIGLVGLAWAVVTFFVVPVILVEGNGSLSAISRSKDLMIAKWGKVGRSGLRFGLVFLPMMLGAVAIVGVGVFLLISGLAIVGIVVAAAGIVGLLTLSLLSNAVGTYLRLVLYRYAVGLPVPGIAPQTLAYAIRPAR